MTVLIVARVRPRRVLAYVTSALSAVEQVTFGIAVVRLADDVP